VGAMTTMIRDATRTDRRVVLHGVSWETYQGLLHSDESRRGAVRMTYDLGRLVLMSPSQKHEQDAELLGMLIRLAAAGLGLGCMGVGRMTLKREALGRGKEADTAFYLASEPLVRGKSIDLEVDPPPDLAVEVEIAHSDPEMLAVYAALGVPEVWRYDGEHLRAFQLQVGGSYRQVGASPGLPRLPLDDIPRWLDRAEAQGETAMLLAFLDWVRVELMPPGPVPPDQP
jgi:Uma2 family endonuclease